MGKENNLLIKNVGGVISAVGGAILSIAGIIGAFGVGCIASIPICGLVCGGPIIALLGVGIAGFLAKYSLLFIILGGLLFFLGVFLMIRKKRSCDCPVSENNKKDLVKKAYAEVAKKNTSCCEVSEETGYSKEDLRQIPDSANLGLGCGNPIAFSNINKTDIVLDLGCGAGIDCFLAARFAKEVIGIDVTPEMIKKAKDNAKRGRYRNVHFRLGDLESLPIEDKSVDLVISNCVINLIENKNKVFEEIYRVLKAGGRMVISDIALKDDLPEHIKKNPSAYVSCISGAVKVDEYLKIIESVGLSDIKILSESASVCSVKSPDPFSKNLPNLLDTLVSLTISAKKP